MPDHLHSGEAGIVQYAELNEINLFPLRGNWYQMVCMVCNPSPWYGLLYQGKVDQQGTIPTVPPLADVVLNFH